MLITHALHNQKAPKGQTPKRKIKQIVTSKRQAVNLSNNSKLNINKENQNPNIKRSPSPQQQGLQKQRSIKSLSSKGYQNYLPSNNSFLPQQSSIKKILFVKNVGNYKSTKTSKNSSLEKKEQSQQQIKYHSLNHHNQQQNELKRNNIQPQNYSNSVYEVKNRCQTSTYFNDEKRIENNESDIQLQNNRMGRHSINEFKTKNMIAPQNRLSMMSGQSQSGLRLKTVNQKQAISNLVSQASQQLYPPSPPINFPNNFSAQYPSSKQTRFCPNIQSPDLSSIQSFKNKPYLFSKKTSAKALISIEKEKKQGLSNKKRNSRIKINHKTTNQFDQTSELNLSNCIHNQQNCSKTEQAEINKHSEQYETQRYNSFQKQSKVNCIEKTFCSPQQSTLLQTKSQALQSTLGQMSSEFSKITLNESSQNIHHHIDKHSTKFNCFNHPEKQAKFKLNKQISNPYYCSKCTVSLVTQGYKVIENLETKSIRLQKLKNFIFQLQILEPNLNSSKDKLYYLYEEVNKLKRKGEKEVQLYYKALFQTLQCHKKNSLKALDFHANRMIADLKQFEFKLQSNQKQICFLKGDILPNIDLIVNEEKLPQNSFSKIILEHQQKLSSISQNIQNLKSLFQPGNSKLLMKNVEIAENQLKRAINVLQNTQIIFSDKYLALDTDIKSAKQKTFEEIQERSVQSKKSSCNSQLKESKKSFSFDDENIDKSFYFPSSKKKNLMSPAPENLYQLTQSIRLSFGNRFQNNPQSVQSPTFKAI